MADKRAFLRGLRQVAAGRMGPLVLLLMMGGALGWNWFQQQRLQEPCAVVYVIDGDTLQVACPEGEERIRVWGIDAPERKQRPWGDRARRRLEALAGESVALDRVTVDDYGRTVARVLRNGTDLGLQLVRDGSATVYRRFNDDATYREAMRQARDAKRGIWSRKGLQQTPWVWRRKHPR
jgi:endonuclease YncB( thermonuclease family)